MAGHQVESLTVLASCFPLVNDSVQKQSDLTCYTIRRNTVERGDRSTVRFFSRSKLD